MINLLTSLATVKTELEKTTTTQDRYLDSLIEIASGECEKFTDRKLRGRTYGSGGLPAEITDGTGYDFLYPSQYPIISVTSIHDDTGHDFDSTTLKAATDYQVYDDNIQLLNDAVSGTRFTDGKGNIKLIYTAGYDRFEIISGQNDRLDFEETESTPLVATIATGVYTSATLITAILVGLNAAGASVYTATYNSHTSAFTITSDLAGAGNKFILTWATGANAYRSIGRTIGFDVSADDAHAASHTSDYGELGIPADLERACIIVLKRMYKESDVSSNKRFDISQDKVGGAGGADSGVNFRGGIIPREAEWLLKKYKRIPRFL